MVNGGFKGERKSHDQLMSDEWSRYRACWSTRVLEKPNQGKASKYQLTAFSHIIERFQFQTVRYLGNAYHHLTHPPIETDVQINVQASGVFMK